MKPLSIRARNLRTWRELGLELPEGIAAIVGPNGAGKSTLVAAIDLALFGTGREMKRALSRGAGEELVEVELVFEHRGESYRVVRGYNVRSGGKPELRLEVSDPLEDGWLSIGGKTVTDTQEILEELLGLSRQTFRASSYLAQDDGAAFTMAEPRDRKAILLDALGVRVWDELKVRATMLRTEAERELSLILSNVERLEADREHLDGARAAHAAAASERERLSREVEDLERGIAERRRELEDSVRLEAQAEARRAARDTAAGILAEAEAKEAELARRIAEVASLEAKRTSLAGLASFRPTLASLAELRRKGAALRPALDNASRVAAHHRELEAQATKEADAGVEQVAALELQLREAVDCPTCGRMLDGEALERAQEKTREALRAGEAERDKWTERAVEEAKRGYAAELDARKIEDELVALEREHAELLSRLPDTLRLIAPEVALSKADAAERDLAAADARLEHVRADSEELSRVRGRLPALRLAADSAKAAADEITGTPAAEHRSKLEVAEAELRSRRSFLDLKAKDEATAQARVTMLERAGEELAAQKVALAERKDDVALYKLAEKAFGREGVPALILESAAIPQLEVEANRIVAELGRDYRFELRTQRATQAGDVKEVLDIVVLTDTGAAMYEDFSGGERARIDLALRIALARLLASRRGAECRVLAIDEPSFLDDDGFEKLAGVLRSLAGEFDSILVVSHVEELRNAFDSAISVEGGADTGEPSRLASTTEEVSLAHS